MQATDRHTHFIGTGLQPFDWSNIYWSNKCTGQMNMLVVRRASPYAPCISRGDCQDGDGDGEGANVRHIATREKMEILRTATERKMKGKGGRVGGRRRGGGRGGRQEGRERSDASLHRETAFDHTDI